MKRVIRIITIAWMAVSAICIAFMLVTICMDVDKIISDPALLQIDLSSNEFYSTLAGLILFYSIIICLCIMGIGFLVGMIIITAKDQLNKL